MSRAGRYIWLAFLSLLWTGAIWARSGWKEKVKKYRYCYIDSVYWWSSERSTRVVVRLKAGRPYTAYLLKNPPRLCIDIERAVLHPPKRTWSIEDGLVHRVRAAQFSPKKARVVLDLGDVRGYNIFSLSHPDRIVIDLFPKIPKPSPGEPSLVRQLGAKVKRIVLDPGHGGRDPGAIGLWGIKEKDVVLDICKRARSILLRRGYEVYLTRTRDVFVPLEARTAFANQKHADLFVSVHLNFSRNRMVSGTETYYLSFASDREAKELAAFENATASNRIGDIEKVLKRILKNTKIKESRALASVVQESLASRCRRKDRGVRSAPFVVLIGANMPAVLVEICFISNPKEARLIKEGWFRQRVAEALADGVERYASRLAAR